MIYTALAYYRLNQSVLMVKKGHGPAAVRGKWNFIGGKVERGEELRGAMAREFKEETGICINPTVADHCLILVGSDFTVHFFRCRAFESVHLELPPFNDAGEKLDWQFPLAISMDDGECVPNLRWIWPLMLDRQIQTPVMVYDRS